MTNVKELAVGLNLTKYEEVIVTALQTGMFDDVSENKTGELVRAVSGIWLRYYRDHEMISSVNPVRDVNSMARFIHAEYPDTRMDEVVWAMWDLEDDLYPAALRMLCEELIKYTKAHLELLNEKNDCDCLDYYEVADMEKDDEDYSGCETFEWQEKEDLKMYPKRSC